MTTTAPCDRQLLRCPAERRASRAATHRGRGGKTHRSGGLGALVRARSTGVADAGRHRRQTGLHRRRPCGRRGRWLSAEQLSGRAAVCARAVPDDVCQPAVDHPPVRRVLHRRGFQRVLPPQPGRRSEGAVGRLRPGHPPRLRLRPSPRAGRRRNGRRGNRFHPRHAAAVRRHRPVDGVGVDDDERRGAADPGAVRGGRRGAGGAAGEAGRHHPERHPQRVHGPQHLHLPAQAVDAHHLRHLRLHQRQDAEVQLHLDLRLPHPRSRCHSGFGAGLHAGRRRRLHQGGPGRRAWTSTSSRPGCRSSGASG